MVTKQIISHSKDVLAVVDVARCMAGALRISVDRRPGRARDVGGASTEMYTSNTPFGAISCSDQPNKHVVVTALLRTA